MLFKKKNISELQDSISHSNNITIITHANPDGDAIGSTSGISNFLKEQGHDSTIIFPNTPAEGMDFVLKDLDYIIAEQDFKRAKETLLNTDLLFVVDMCAKHRANENLETILNTIQVKTILIDHHESPEEFDISFSYPKASSACEVAYNVITRLSKTKILSKNVSTCLYMGMLTDTGGFSYSNTDPNLYITLSNLVKSGIRPDKLNQQIFNTYSYNRLRLLGSSINENMQYFPKQKAVLIALDRKTLRHYHYVQGDLENVVNYGLKIRGVVFAALISEREKNIRMSFRSTDESIDVNLFARTYWNGGGHKMASGGRGFDTFENVKKRLIDLIKQNAFNKHN